jgi:L-cysteine S-thiosulfotransferase
MVLSRGHCERALTSLAPRLFSALRADGLCAFDPIFLTGLSRFNFRETPLIANLTFKSGLALALLLGAAGPARAQSAAAEGQKLAFDRGKGNCLTCHVIKGGDLPGTIGPELVELKKKYPNRDDLVAIVSDETKRNPLTVMPPFGRNRILTEKEIDAVVDFLQTL